MSYLRLFDYQRDHDPVIVECHERGAADHPGSSTTRPGAGGGMQPKITGAPRFRKGAGLGVFGSDCWCHPIHTLVNGTQQAAFVVMRWIPLLRPAAVRGVAAKSGYPQSNTVGACAR